MSFVIAWIFPPGRTPRGGGGPVSESERFTPEAFIAAAGWQAAARPFRDAHEYTRRGRVTAGVEPPPVEEHDAMIEHIGANGEPGEFEGIRTLVPITFASSNTVTPAASALLANVERRS
jgi:hypothetical protein